MTAKQILDAFSETLMQDERILTPRERELLMSILQNSRTVSSSDPETQSAVTAAIARSVGETVAQRAFALLGGSIVQQIAGQFDSGRNVGVLDAPAIMRGQCVVLDEFLAPQELDELVSYTLQHKGDFQTSEVISPSGD